MTNHRELDEFIRQLRSLGERVKDVPDAPQILGQVEQVLAGMAQRIRELEGRPPTMPDDGGPLAEQALHALMAYVVSRSRTAGVP